MTDETQVRNANGDLDALLAFVKEQREIDFSGYKKTTLERRIKKRLQRRNVGSYDEYRLLLESDPDEFVELVDTVLINVTSFFRDETAWRVLAEEIIPRLLEARMGEPLRIWSAGCASGEEAFSVAMLLCEALGDDDFKPRVKIYATDVDEDALSTGRRATFSPKQVADLRPELHERYFVSENQHFVFRSDIRRSVIFGRHNLVSDPPISKIDLLLSRNTLMYFESDAQRQILERFHFALRNDGYLFLGKAEALAARTELFVPLDLKSRIFTKVPRDELPRRAVDPEHAAVVPPTAELKIREAGLDQVPVAFIVVDYEGRLALANLQARVYFGLTPYDVGRPIQDLEVSFRPLELRSRLEQVHAERHSVTVREVEWYTPEELRYLDIQISPLTAKTGELLGCGVTFTDVSRYRRLQSALQEAKLDAETAYEALQATNEELETTNEELQATNEELETTNEELQATNEELETTNEELQATNEELETTNEEVNQRGFDLNEANMYLEAILTSLRAGVAVVNDELRVQAWNEGARDLWGLTAAEAVGQHLLNLDIGLPMQELGAEIRRLLGGDEEFGGPLHADAINRRGRPVRTTISLTRLRTSERGRGGVILMMQSEDRT